MKKYLLFAGDRYEPSGGVKDFVGSFDSIGDCIKHVATMSGISWDWYHIADRDTLEIVESDQKW